MASKLLHQRQAMLQPHLGGSSYQYQLKNNSIYNLYQLANINYQGTINRISRDTILKVASDYNANQYWVERKAIGESMKKYLNEALQEVFAE